jgi:hypothetical protein
MHALIGNLEEYLAELANHPYLTVLVVLATIVVCLVLDRKFPGLF